MQIIHPEVSLVKDVLGHQKKKNVLYRFFHYVIQQEVANGLLLYNILTRCMVLLDSKEVEEMYHLDVLVKHWFLVPQEHDDQKLCRQVRSMAKLLRPIASNITNYTILPTTECNARCFYCFERGTTQTRMNSETAAQVVEYIKTHCGKNSVNIRWFGGEPLYNHAIIEQICLGLKGNNIDYESNMISNGYLFSPELVMRAKEIWNLKKIQITLDGTKDIYNRTKAYICEDNNPYNRVLNNVRLLLDEHIQVKTRLNMSPYNIDDLYLLIDELNEKFGKSRYFSLYVTPLFEKSDVVEHGLSYKKRAELFKKQIGLLEYLNHIGLYSKRVSDKLQNTILTHACMVDSGEAVLITPEGNISLCDHYYHKYTIGHINTPNIDDEMVQMFKEQAPEIPECNYCPGYPDCFRLKVCAEGRICQPEAQEAYRHRLRLSMVNVYNKYLLNNNE